MSDHEFERQVHQKLEELKLRPSDTVWMEVEKKIRQDKRRRRFLWLWASGIFICLSTSAYILYHYTFHSNNTPAGIAKAVPTSSSNKTITESTHTSTQQTTTNFKPVLEHKSLTRENLIDSSLLQSDNQQPIVATPEATPGKTTTTTTLSNKEQAAIAVTEKSATTNKGTIKGTIGINNKKPVKQPFAGNDHDGGQVAGLPNYGYTHEKHFTRSRKRKTEPVAGVIKKENNARVQQQPIGAVTVDAVQPEEQDDMTATMPMMVNDGDKTITISKAAPAPFNHRPLLLAPDSTNTRTAARVPIPRIKPSLWHWGVKANAGYSRIAVSKLFQLQGLLGTNKSYAEDLSARSTAGNNVNLSSPNYNSLINYSSISNAAAPPVKKASPIQPDFAASAGVFIQRTLSPRLKLSVGLEYSYMSVNTQIGQMVDSSISVNVGPNSLKVVPKFYKSPGYVDVVRGGITADRQSQGTDRVYYSEKQRYRFHYIEIPVMLNWQMNKGRRLPPLVFEGGVSIGRLFSVDAMHYEGLKGVYYEADELFNKTQFNFVTGLNVGLLQHSKHPIWVGPNLRYSLNGLVKKEVSTGQYLWSTGISIRMLLGRF